MSNTKRAAQRRVLLDLLRGAGNSGVSVLTLIYQHGILRASGRVLELRTEGYTIETRPGQGGTAIYVLIAEPKPCLPFAAVGACE